MNADGQQTIGQEGFELISSTCGRIPLFYDYGTGASNVCTLEGVSLGLGLNNYTNTNYHTTLAAFYPQPVTIDITEELPVLTNGWQQNYYYDTETTVAGILIGLPTAEFYIHEMYFRPMIDDDITPNNSPGDTNDTAGNDDQDFAFLMEDITFSVLGGWMEIAPTPIDGDPAN
jgi:hypothetical protein